MGERGHTVHVRDGELGTKLARLDARVAVLGCNERWTTFVPMDAASFDDALASKALDVPLVHLWFEEDVSLSARFYVAGELVGELWLAGEDSGVNASNIAVVDRLVEHGFVRTEHHEVLLERLRAPLGLGGWTMAHGLEELLELPYYHPIPADLPEHELLERLLEAGVVLQTHGAISSPR